MQVTPLTPQEAVEQKLSDVPTKVLQCWNKIIKANLNKTSSSVTSRFTLDELAKMISLEMVCSFDSAKNKALSPVCVDKNGASPAKPGAVWADRKSVV